MAFESRVPSTPPSPRSMTTTPALPHEAGRLGAAVDGRLGHGSVPHDSTTAATARPVVDAFEAAHLSDATHAARPERSRAPAAPPPWADATFFADVAARASTTTTTTPAAGSALTVRAQALRSKAAERASETEAQARRTRGRSLLARAARAFAVIGGVPMSDDEIARTKTAVHLTHATAVAPIVRDGLLPTVGLYKNATSWCRDAVYMFARPPSALQMTMNLAGTKPSSLEVIEIDLTKLDPDRLYRRVLDGALLYVSSDPIPPTALRHLGPLAASTTGGS